MGLEALSCLVLLRLGIVPAAGEIGKPEFVADVFNDTKQSIFFNPALRSKILSLPKVLPVLPHDSAHDVGRAVPSRRAAHVAGAVFDRLPVDQPRPAGILDGDAELLVFGLLVRDQRARDELIKEPAQR
jgi:hypothetical protein